MRAVARGVALRRVRQPRVVTGVDSDASRGLAASTTHCPSAPPGMTSPTHGPKASCDSWNRTHVSTPALHPPTPAVPAAPVSARPLLPLRDAHPARPRSPHPDPLPRRPVSGEPPSLCVPGPNDASRPSCVAATLPHAAGARASPTPSKPETMHGPRAPRALQHDRLVIRRRPRSARVPAHRCAWAERGPTRTALLVPVSSANPSRPGRTRSPLFSGVAQAQEV